MPHLILSKIHESCMYEFPLTTEQAITVLQAIEIAKEHGLHEDVALIDLAEAKKEFLNRLHLHNVLGGVQFKECLTSSIASFKFE